MALNAKFYADFTSFYDAVQKAEGHLKGFEADADKTGAALDKMVDQFSGRKVLEQATVMSKAVAEIGGTANLTDANLRKIGATVGEASEQLRRMGKDVPKDFQDITKAAEGVQKPTEGWASSLSLVKGGIAAIVSSGFAKYVMDSAKAGIEWAGALSRVHAQTDISYKDLQILQDVAIETSTDMSALTRSVMVLQERLGDRTGFAGLRALRINVDDFLKLNPAQQLRTVAEALAKMTDEDKRAAAAKSVFGNAYREALPALRANWAEIEKNTKQVSGDQIEAVDRLSAKWNIFWNNQDKAWGAWMGKWAKGLEEGARNWENAKKKGWGDGSDLPTLPGAPTPLQAGGVDHVAGIADPEVISRIRIGGQTLAEQTAKIQENTRALTESQREAQRFADAVTQSLERVRYSHYALGQSAVTASQNVQGFSIRMSETVAINTDYSRTLMDAQIKTDSFGHALTNNVMPSLQGIGGATYQAGLRATETASKQDILNARMNDVTGILGGIQTGWAQMATVGAKAIQGITNDLISGNWVGAIMKGTAALSGFIGKLFSASEESKKVSPMRDEFFRLQGGLERLNPRVQELEGNLESVQAVFDARTVQQYDAAIANLNRILAQDKTHLDKATDAAADLEHQLNSIPTKIPITVQYKETGNPPKGTTGVPGYATGTDGKFVDFGSGTLAMLHGKEAIVPQGAVPSIAGSVGATGAPVVITINAQGAFFDTPGDLQRLADKVNDALTARYGLSNRARAA